MHFCCLFLKLKKAFSVSLKTLQYSQETPVLGSLFNKVAGLKASNLLKRESNAGIFL